MKGVTRNNEMNGITLLLLFLTSYTPLFLLIAIRYTLINRSHFIFGGLSIAAIKECLKWFGIPIVLFLLSFLSIVFCYKFLQKLDKDSKNGDKASIEKIENRNSESLGYIASYILPFISMNGEDIVELFTFIILMIIIFVVYIRSNMVLINPILNINYSIYNIEYKCGKDKIRNGMVIVKGHDMGEDEK